MQIFELSHQASGAAVVISNTDGYNGSGVLSKSDVEDLKSMHEAAICRVVTNSCFGKLEKKKNNSTVLAILQNNKSQRLTKR